jgi:GT2 family glycosyltransferase
MSTVAPLIQAVVVNHNTSCYTELALRSLFATHPQLPSIAVTILDNDSTDDIAPLRRFAASRGIAFLPSGQPFVTPVNSHGDALRAFVLAHPQGTHYLFLDADVCFVQPDTLNTMLAELDAAPDAFAVQARTTWDGETESPNAGGFSTTPDGPTELTYAMVHPWCSPDDPPPAQRLLTAPGVAHARCHPFCALIRNTPAFRAVAQHIGFSAAWIFANGLDFAGSYDTFGLASAVMKTHGYRWIPSQRLVFHFCCVTYDGRTGSQKQRDCLERLKPLRAVDAASPHEPSIPIHNEGGV